MHILSVLYQLWSIRVRDSQPRSRSLVMWKCNHTTWLLTKLYFICFTWWNMH